MNPNNNKTNKKIKISFIILKCQLIKTIYKNIQNSNKNLIKHYDHLYKNSIFIFYHF